MRPLALALALLLLAPGRSDAEERPLTVERQVLALRVAGTACYRRRQYRCALEKFAQAFALRPSAELRYNVASAEDKLGLAAAAVNHYRAYLREEGSRAPGHVLAHIPGRLQRLLPLVGELTLQVQPGDVTITAEDGTSVTAVSGAAVMALAPGRHQLQLTRAGSVARGEEVVLAAGERRTLQVSLAPEVGHGSLSILAQPTPAEVWLDGVRQPRPSPLTVSRVREGWHRVQLASGQLCATRHVEVARGLETRLEVALAPQAGRLEVSGAPTGAAVWVDGQPAVGPVMMGEHRVAVTHPGYLPWTGTIRLGCLAPTARVAVRLERAAVLRITSTPSGARLRLDGVAAGTTPARVQVRPGRHQVTLERAGHLALEQEVVVTAGDVRETALVLEPSASTKEEARRRRKRTVVAGVLLGVAGAGAVTMGVLYGVGRRQGDDAYASYRAATTDAGREEHGAGVASAQRLLVGGHVALGASLVALGLSAYYFFTGRPTTPAEEPAPPALPPGSFWQPR